MRVRLDGLGTVTLTLFNLLGQEAWTLFDGRRPAGETQETLSAAGMSSGTYILCAVTHDVAAMRKLQLVR